jgi:predicted regulator of Ras-like GTPase activity (Roadblock/LC7/MglB family)
MKQLEDDMSEVLSIISKKMKLSKKEESTQIPPPKKDTLKKISPSNLNDILNQLFKLDQYIEASAIIKEDGTILASVLSNRISDSLFVTIGQNLSMIGSDIIEGLSAGKLTSISIKGTEGILDIVQVDNKNPQLKDMILMIFSHVRVKSGIIAFATKIVRNQIIEYLKITK